MSDIPAELRFAESHEWARLETDGTVTPDDLEKYPQLVMSDSPTRTGCIISYNSQAVSPVMTIAIAISMASISDTLP